MNALTKFATRGAVLLLTMTALAVWLVVGHGGPTESAGGLEISVTDAPDPVALGGIVTYTITVNNTGATEEPGVLLTETVAGPGVIQVATPSQGSCDPPTPTTVVCLLGTLAAGTTATITIAAQAIVPVGGTPVGGTTELLVDDSDAPASAGDGSGSPVPYAAAAAAGALVLAAGGWYARRRWLA